MATKGTRCPIEMAISPRHTVSQSQWLPREPGVLDRWLLHQDSLKASVMHVKFCYATLSENPTPVLWADPGQNQHQCSRG